MDAAAVEKVISQYDEKKGLYGNFLERILGLIREFAEADGLMAHSYKGWIREREDLKSWLQNGGEVFENLSDVNDVAYIRVITFFESDVEIISQIVRREFSLFSSIECSSSRLKDPDRFGYVSRCHIVGLLENRLELIEYKRFRGCLVKIEIRSLLQQAWAEIDARFGFEGKNQFPTDMARNYARVAGLFEVADSELNLIMDHIFFRKGPQPTATRPPSVAPDCTIPRLAPRRPQGKPRPPDSVPEGATSPIPQRPEKPPVRDATPAADTLISRSEIEEFVLSDKSVREFDRQIADYLDTRLIYQEKSIEILQKAVGFLDIPSTAHLKGNLTDHGKYLFPIAKASFGDLSEAKVNHLSKGFSILILCYTLVAKKGHLVHMHRFLRKFSLENSGISETLASKMIGIYTTIEMGKPNPVEGNLLPQ